MPGILIQRLAAQVHRSFTACDTRSRAHRRSEEPDWQPDDGPVCRISLAQVNSRRASEQALRGRARLACAQQQDMDETKACTSVRTLVQRTSRGSRLAGKEEHICVEKFYTDRHFAKREAPDQDCPSYLNLVYYQ